eukprot:6455905-Amphidinium_carterae.2
MGVDPRTIGSRPKHRVFECVPCAGAPDTQGLPHATECDTAAVPLSSPSTSCCPFSGAYKNRASRLPQGVIHAALKSSPSTKVL